jgi:hypothetical protein
LCSQREQAMRAINITFRIKQDTAVGVSALDAIDL